MKGKRHRDIWTFPYDTYSVSKIDNHTPGVGMYHEKNAIVKPNHHQVTSSRPSHISHMQSPSKIGGRLPISPSLSRPVGGQRHTDTETHTHMTCISTSHHTQSTDTHGGHQWSLSTLLAVVQRLLVDVFGRVVSRLLRQIPQLDETGGGVLTHTHTHTHTQPCPE